MTQVSATRILPSPKGEADQSPENRFRTLQTSLLAHYGAVAESRFVHIAAPRMTVHVLEAGSGEPVVIVHGGDGEAATWAPLIGSLQHHAHIFAVDRPGFGLSDSFDYRRVDLRTHAADFVGSVMDALGLGSATLVGGSMGGFFVLSAALAHPKRVKGLVLAGYPVGATKQMPLSLRIICGVPLMARLFMRGRASMKAQKSQYRSMFHVDPATVPDVYFETRIAGIKLPSERGTWATLLPRVANIHGLRPGVFLGDELSRIVAPVLLIFGEHDMAAPEVGRAIAQRFHRGTFEYLPGVGHFPFLEAPVKTADLIAKFLGEKRESRAVTLAA